MINLCFNTHNNKSLFFEDEKLCLRTIKYKKRVDMKRIRKLIIGNPLISLMF